MPNNIPQTNTASVTDSIQDKPLVTEKCGKDCDQCLKGGMPLKRELLSFFVILLIGLSTLLTVLFVNEKRKSVVYAPTTEVEQTAEVARDQKKYEMPSVKTMIAMVDLPSPVLTGTSDLEEVIANRRSRRTFAETPVTLENLSQVLWSAQGITDKEHGYRAAPSGKSAYPYTMYVVVRNVEDLKPGLYEYLPEKNQLGDLGMANAGDILAGAGVQDGAIKAPVVLVMAAAPAKMVGKFPDSDPMKNVYLEAGHIGQNIYLEVESLDMATVVMGGFSPVAVGEALKLDVANEEIVYIVPVGNRLEE